MPNRIAKSHDDVLEELAAALDIPDSKFLEAKNSYKSLGEWLCRDESTLCQYAPAISPQGSFRLGTVTRPLNDADEYDVDLVCKLDATKEDFTQKGLKEAVGKEVLLYANARNMSKRPGERRRCWTLHYAEGAQFHMDILPAIPDGKRFQTILMERGYTTLSSNQALSGNAIAITDNTLPQYGLRTDDWPQSNPSGYAAWFRSRMEIQLTERMRVMAKSIEKIPDHEAKTPLQRAIQLLKRHRDTMFATDGLDKPISIIITTLAAHAYQGEATISEALRSILNNMSQHVMEYNGVAWVANPVNPAENFADKWAENPKKRKNFYAWLEQARHDFAIYLRGRYDALPIVLNEALGRDLVDRTLAAILPTAAASLSVPAVVKGASGVGDMPRAVAAVVNFERKGVQSRPWAKS